MDELISFGHWMRRRRKELGIPQDELADTIGCSLAALEKIESGKRRPSRQMALLLADYLKIPGDEREAFVIFARAGQSSHSLGPASGEVALRAPWRDVFLRKTNLPSVLSPLIGREQDEAAARGYVLNPRARLITLVGAPGIGKTRLAIQVAHDLVEHFEDGVFFVDLAPVVDPDLVLQTVTRALGLKESTEKPIESVLVEYVRDRRMLLVLDNFEQVLDAATAISGLLEGSPWLKVLVTSREALHVRGERCLSVPPLKLPDPSILTMDDGRWTMDGSNKSSSTGQRPLTEALADYPSVQLFVDHAQAVSSEFRFTQENAGDIAAVCIELEGLPLAIELAAAHTKHISPHEMRAAIGERLRLLTGGSRDLPARQRTLRNAIEWSYDLLGSREQALFRSLGVFVGGFTMAAVEAICKAGDGEQGSAATADALMSLVSKSLVKHESWTMSGAGESGEARFGLLETIREYAWEKLHEAGRREEATVLERRHALYFMKMVEDAEPVLSGSAEEKDWLLRLDAEHNNLLAALRWARAVGVSGKKDKPDADGSEDREVAEAVEVGLRIVGVLWRFWYARGYLSEWQEYLTTVLGPSPSAGPLLKYRAKALTGAGTLAIWRGDYASARPLFEESLAIRREIGDKRDIAKSLSNLGVIAGMQGDYVAARAFYGESLAIRREIGDDKADKAGMAALLHNLGDLAGLQGDYDSARPLYEESLALRREIGGKDGIANALRELGMAVYRLGDPSSGRSLLEESLSIAREVDDKLGTTGVLDYLGTIAFDRGDYASAHSLFRESLALRREIGATVAIAASLARLGQLAATVGEAYRGASLLGAAAALREKVARVPGPYARRIYEEGLERAQAQLEEEVFAEAWSEGYALSMEEAVANALDSPIATIQGGPGNRE